MTDERTRIAQRLFHEQGKPYCNCGADDGTHSPDCSWVQAHDRAWADAGEILYVRDEA